MERPACVLQNFPLERLDAEGSRPFDALSEAFVFGQEKTLNVEIVVDDAILRFGEDQHDVSMGDQLQVSESAATFLSLKGWAKLVLILHQQIQVFSWSNCGKVQG